MPKASLRPNIGQRAAIPGGTDLSRCRPIFRVLYKGIVEDSMSSRLFYGVKPSQHSSKSEARMRHWKTIFVIGAAALLFAVVAWGQGSVGTITGTVADPSGASVAGATVTATNTGTGMNKKTTTNALGQYSFVEMPPGMYTISVEAAGFAKTTLSEQRLIVASNLRLDVTLEVGAINESVTVDTAAPQVNVEDAQLGRSLTNISSLPLLSTNGGRNALSLVGIQPGVVTASASETQ